MITIEFVPFDDITGLPPKQVVNKLFKIVMNKKVVLLEGRLTPEEEADLIQKTMRSINNRFKGIEIATLSDITQTEGIDLRKGLLKLLMGRRHGLTLIGPATIIKEIKRDPNKIQLLTKD